MKNKTFVTIQKGSLTGSIGELMKNKKVFVNNKAFNFDEDEYVKSSFEELFNLFLKDKKVVKFEKGAQIFENGFSLYFYHDRSDLFVEMVDAEGNIVIDSQIS